jgi:hypothetical protein
MPTGYTTSWDLTLAGRTRGGRRGGRGARFTRQGSMRSTSPLPTEMLRLET